jgi:hypothetical protein
MDLLGLVMPAWARWVVILAAAAVLYGTGRVHQARDDQAEQLEIEHARTVANVDRLVRRAAVAAHLLGDAGVMLQLSWDLR